MVAVEKVKGDENPADLMTIFLGKAEVEERLRRMKVEVEWQREEEVQLRRSEVEQLAPIGWHSPKVEG